jgi:glyoxylase-like metal-dependent hydrolase (beta-lactamase superfamily II)
VAQTLRIERVPVSPIEQNCRILYTDGGREAIVIDPGGDADKVLATLDRIGRDPAAIWLTHSHLDHCGGVAPFLAQRPVPLYGHPNDQRWRESVEVAAASFGMPPGVFFNCPEPTDELLGGEVLALDGLEFQVLVTPGHCPGHVAFYQPDNNVVFSGDCLFKGSIGRTDFPGCDHALLLKSIREVLYALPDETRVLSGHGPETQIGIEKRTNPFVNA